MNSKKMKEIHSGCHLIDIDLWVSILLDKGEPRIGGDWSPGPASMLKSVSRLLINKNKDKFLSRKRSEPGG